MRPVQPSPRASILAFLCLSGLIGIGSGAGAAPAPAASSQSKPRTAPATNRAAAPQVAGATARRTTPIPTSVLISELRAIGPRGAGDGFVELWNHTAKPMSLAGWTLRFRDDKGVLITFKMAPDARIEARSHLLFTGRDYSLAGVAAGDVALESSIGGGVRLCDARGKLVDAAGPGGENIDHEGAGLPNWLVAPARPKPSDFALIPQFSYVRLAPDGEPQDTGDNARDFALVSVSGLVANRPTRIGTPGPENAASPRLRPLTEQRTDAAAPDSNAPDSSEMAPDAQLVVLQTDPARNSMRRLRRTTRPFKHGTMLLRFRFVNDSPDVIRTLSLRVNSITGGDPGAIAGQADVRVLRASTAAELAPEAVESGSGTGGIGASGGVAASESATTESATTESATTESATTESASSEAETDAPGVDAPIKRTTSIWRAKLASAPAQPLGGALNALVAVDLPSQGIAPGARGEILFSFGVERLGDYRVVLGNERFNLVFEGNTEDDQRPENIRQASAGNWTQGAAHANGRGDASANGSNAVGRGTETDKEENKATQSYLIEGQTDEEGAETGPEDKTEGPSGKTS